MFRMGGKAAACTKFSIEIPQNPDEKIKVGGCCRESCGSCWILTHEVEENAHRFFFMQFHVSFGFRVEEGDLAWWSLCEGKK
ncbi:hypothetical protein H5410_032788 [Solanum commersonii]|uniref:Uncharacterized protein n=1 Tax=Solanum commersonii TaxID=4109 RepID=A0A9J5YLW4_SOLCO|nr:hypothetical protein H5410_032788 [Solanum commersonii]